MQLSKEIGVEYRTAWYMLHRIREACTNSEFKLNNIVEMDETYIGGLEKNKHADKKLNAGRGRLVKFQLLEPKNEKARLLQGRFSRQMAKLRINLRKKRLNQGRPFIWMIQESTTISHSIVIQLITARSSG